MKNNFPRITTYKNNYSFVLAGLFFGLLQSSLYFTIQVYVTAAYMGYFVMILGWMTGNVYILRSKKTPTLIGSLLISIISYYLLILIVIPFGSEFPIQYIILPIGIFLVSLPAGSFFRDITGKIKSDSIFFHENNGFLIGMILGLLLFVKYGIYTIYYAPALSLAIFIGSIYFRRFFILIPVSAAVLAAIYLGQYGIFFILVLFIALLLIAMAYPVSIVRNRETNDSLDSGDKKINMILLLLAGFNLIILQFYITREFSNILSANELTVLIVAASYFAGYSIGYKLSRFLPMRLIKYISIVMFVIHTLMFIFTREIAGVLMATGFGISILYGELIFISFFTSSLYSIFLPKIISLIGEKSLSWSYSIDLMGAILAVLLSGFLLIYQPTVIPLLYLSVLLMIIVLQFRGPVFKTVILGTGLYTIFLFAFYQGEIHRLNTEDYYRARDVSYPELIFSANSFYHTVDILESYSDKTQSIPYKRSSFINGIKYFENRYNEDGKFSGDTPLSEFTYYLAELPATYLYNKLNRKLDILILGAGSMYSINRVSPYSGMTTIVEIDPVIIESAKKCWSDFNLWDSLDNYEIIIDDAKHYLQTTDKKFDLIIMDISAPYYLGTALMHNTGTYKIISERLQKGGIFSESTQSRPESNQTNTMAMKILKGVSVAFPNYLVVDTRLDPRGKHGYVYASKEDILNKNLFMQIAEDNQMSQGIFIYLKEDNRYNLSRTKSYSLYNMETLLSGNKNRMEGRLKKNPGYMTYYNLDFIRKILRQSDFKLTRKIMAKIKSVGFIINYMLVFGISMILGKYVIKKFLDFPDNR